MKEIMQHVDILTALNPYYAYDLLIIPTVLAARSYFAPQEPKPYILI
jgi:hypothetical protein